MLSGDDSEARGIAWWLFWTIMMASSVPALLTVAFLSERGSARSMGSTGGAVLIALLLTMRLLRAFVVVVTELQEERAR